MLLGGRALGSEAELLPLVLRGVPARLYPGDGGSGGCDGMSSVPGSYRVMQCRALHVTSLWYICTNNPGYHQVICVTVNNSYICKIIR